MLKLWDMTNVIKTRNEKESKRIVRYFVQEDVYDFHIYRIVEGTYDELEVGAFTVEWDKVSKIDVLERMQVDIGTMDVREALNYLDKYTSYLNALIEDVERGFENHDCKAVDTLDEAMNRITENGFYPFEEIIYEDVETEDEENDSGLHLCSSLYHMDNLRTKLLEDKRSLLYKGVLLRPYQNGREQGFAVVYTDAETGDKHAISFSQERRSDSIVVHHGEASDSSISEEAYSNRRSFPYRHYNRTINYIYDLLNDHAEKQESEGIAVAEGLKVADQMLQKLLTHSRKNEYWASVESLQDKDIDGYSVFFMENGGKINNIGFTGNSEEIRLLIGKNYFQGVDPKHEKVIFPINQLEEAITFLFNILDEKAKKLSIK